MRISSVHFLLLIANNKNSLGCQNIYCIIFIKGIEFFIFYRIG